MGKAAVQYCPTKPYTYKDLDFNCQMLWSTHQCSATARPWGCNVYEGKHRLQELQAASPARVTAICAPGQASWGGEAKAEA